MRKTFVTFAAGLSTAAAMALSPSIALAGPRVDWSISIGAPGYYEPAPVYQPAPVYSPYGTAAPFYSPYGTYQAPARVYAQPVLPYGYTDPWQEREWRRQQWREQQWREQQWRERMWRRQHGYW